MTRLRRFRKKRRFGALPLSRKEESVRREIAPPSADEPRAVRSEASGRTPATIHEPIPPTTPAAATPIHRGPTRDLTQDPFVLQQTLERLRVEHAELWLSANEQKERLHDVTRDNAALEETCRRYKDLFHLAPDPQLLTDRAGRVHDCNFAAGRLLRIESSHVIGQHLRDLVHPGDLPQLEEALALVATGRAATVDVRMGAKKSLLPVVHVRACPVLTQVDDVLWVVAGSADSSPRVVSG